MSHLIAGKLAFSRQANISMDLNAVDQWLLRMTTNRQKKPAYQGFAKYTDEYNRHLQTSAPAQQTRAQSLSSASQAALAALQKHQKPGEAQFRSNAGMRTSSLSGTRGSEYNRSNSMRSYVYTPKASYSTGPPRANSLRSNIRPQSYNSPNQLRVPHGGTFPEDEEIEEDVIVTTKTTKVVDSLGRTKSITTETVRKLPDGSNIIETKTTNISRSNSRNNSLRTNSITHANGNYNLDKIDEDLHDFDYTYLDHEAGHANDHFNNTVNRSPITSNSNNSPQFIQERRNELARPPFRPEERTSSMGSTASTRRLKSILKNSSSADAAAAFGVQNRDTLETLQHNEASTQLPARLAESPQINGRGQVSNASGASIKFHNTVETISYSPERPNFQEISRDESLKKEQDRQKNLDLYNMAMQVAMGKVYGNQAMSTPPDSPKVEHASPKSTDMREFAEKNSEKKAKNDERRGKMEVAGVNRNYIYENHHRDFALHSLRNGEMDHSTTRKERAKEERKHLKEEEKRRAEMLKAAEKERKKEEKATKKKEKRSFGLFRKHRGSVSEESAVSNEVQGNETVDSHYQESIPEHHPQESPVDLDLQSDRSENFVDVPEMVDATEKIPLPDIHNDEPFEAEGKHLNQNNLLPVIDDNKLPTLISSSSGHPIVIENVSVNDKTDTITSDDDVAAHSSKSIFADAVSGIEDKPEQPSLPLPHLDDGPVIEKQLGEHEVVAGSATNGGEFETDLTLASQDDGKADGQPEYEATNLNPLDAGHNETNLLQHEAEFVPQVQDPLSPPELSSANPNPPSISEEEEAPKPEPHRFGNVHVTQVEQTLPTDVDSYGSDKKEAIFGQAGTSIEGQGSTPANGTTDLHSAPQKVEIYESVPTKKKGKEGKKVAKFKKFIDKYFVNNYSR